MKRVISFLILLLIITVESLYSQIDIKPAFVSVGNKYEFTLPQFDVSLPMPAKAQFMVPKFTGKNIKLEIDDITRYYFDLSYLEDFASFIFYFAMPDLGEEDAMSLVIMKMRRNEVIEIINDAIANKECERISHVKTKLGKTISYRVFDEKNGEEYENYIISKDEYSFVFTVKNNMDKKVKKKYLNIIKKFYQKNQHYLKVKYETQVLNGEFEPKEKKEAPAPPELHEGTVSQTTFFEWPELGYGVEIPIGWLYNVQGKLNSAENSSKLLFHRSLNDDEFMAMNWFRNEQLSLFLRSYTNIDPVDIIKQQAEMTKYQQNVDIIVDGIPCKAYYYGTEEVGSLDFSVEYKKIKHWISFGGVTKKSIPLLEEILSTIKINSDQKRLIHPVGKDLITQLNLKELSPLELDEPLDLTEDWPESRTEMFDCELADLNVKFKLVGKENEYMYTMGDTKGNIKKGIVYGLPENDSDKRLMLFSITGSPISFSVSKKKQIDSLQNYLLNMKRGWSGYNDAEFIYGSLIRVNDLDWGISITRNGSHYLAMSICYIDEYEMMVSGVFDNPEKAIKSISYLKNVYFK